MISNNWPRFDDGGGGFIQGQKERREVTNRARMLCYGSFFGANTGDWEDERQTGPVL